MYYFEVAPTQIIRADHMTFTYSYESSLPVGQIVTMTIGKKVLTGIIVRLVTRPPYDTKPIISIIEPDPIPPALVQLSLWLSDYYVSHLATVLQTILPSGLQKKRRQRSQTPHIPLRDRTTIVFTKDQSTALSEITDMSAGSALLHGVTGSGKTAVYIEMAKRTLANDQSVIVLVPEIALTSQLVDEFSQHFDNVILAHSRQTEAERHLAWRGALESQSPRVVIGARSALFLPLKNIGLIVIDEAHEPSFKQEQSPRYSALRAASMLARFHRAKLIMGSATPTISEYYLAKTSTRPIITMSSPAKPASKPLVSTIDMTKRQHFKAHRFLSDQLLHRLDETFKSGDQALIFHNRRGSATTTLCENCGWQAGCPRCFVPLTLHTDSHLLRCHICGFNDKVPTSCPECRHAQIVHKGIGTKMIEGELRKRYPDKVIMRFDGDSETDETVEQKYKDLYEGTIDLIIGTQVVAKGLDLPKLRTVGVIQADSGLSLPDFGASERTFQLLAQVIGRVGRSHHTTHVVVQSYQPNHYAVTCGLTQDYQQFYEHTIAERHRALFPPFTHLLKLTCSYKTEAAAIKNAKQLAVKLGAAVSNDIQILGPTPAFYERQRDNYRWQLVLKSSKRSELVNTLAHVPQNTHWQVELDPHGLL